jgi:hypothetical protein
MIRHEAHLGNAEEPVSRKWISQGRPYNSLDSVNVATALLKLRWLPVTDDLTKALYEGIYEHLTQEALKRAGAVS